VDSITAFPISRPYRQNDLLIGHVLHIDNFGNVITDLREDSLPSSGQSVTMIIGGYSIRVLSGNYEGGEGPLALFGSSGYLEIALKKASAAALLKAAVGDEIKVKTGD
jgi:S-adenosyl-L-methionine hydrolase (adenosine-forming)